MKAKFFAVGVGPGDPELLTLKAIKTMEGSDVIVVPRSGASENIALKIAEEYIKNKEIVECDMPMIKDQEKLNIYHDQSADLISNLLNNGKTVSFLTLGDPVIYSTVMYVHKRLTERGYDTGIVSGIPSFCAAAASLNSSLCERDEMLHIIPATYTDVDKIVEYDGTKVLMKSGKTIMDIKDKLVENSAMVVECATMENEKVYKDIKDLKEKSSYFSIIVIPSESRQN
ncbi:MAG: precorrin-2 C(20)-methyltransferase [Eubacteriales bacterium]|jgi:precorrin-2/cobalt-factor-2 C20-methyltransferase|nr:precorrin-2 C(20)-methyltransferase [Eubacteriales bacterium]